MFKIALAALMMMFVNYVEMDTHFILRSVFYVSIHAKHVIKLETV